MLMIDSDDDDDTHLYDNSLFKELLFVSLKAISSTLTQLLTIKGFQHHSPLRPPQLALLAAALSQAE